MHKLSVVLYLVENMKNTLILIASIVSSLFSLDHTYSNYADFLMKYVNNSGVNYFEIKKEPAVLKKNGKII